MYAYKIDETYSLYTILLRRCRVHDRETVYSLLKPTQKMTALKIFDYLKGEKIA